MLKSISIQVLGKVQNVGFRFYTKKKAQSIGINGFVKNQNDGSVFAEAEGSSENIDLFIEYCKNGPEWARVDKVNIQEIPFQDYREFKIS